MHVLIFAFYPFIFFKVAEFKNENYFLIREGLQRCGCIMLYFNKTGSSVHFMTVIIIVIKDNSCYGDIIAIKARYFRNYWNYCSPEDQ